MTEQANPTLIGLAGVGTDTGATPLIAARKGQDHLRSSLARAALSGVSPIEVSGGKSPGFLLDRGDNRQVSRAFNRIAVVQMSHQWVGSADLRG